MRGFAALALVAAGWLVPTFGCASAGGPASAPAAPAVDGRAIARAVALCTTTETDLRRQLGEPTRNGRLGDARVVSWIVSQGDVVSYLAVLLDARGVVVDLYWDLPTEIPWTPTDGCVGQP